MTCPEQKNCGGLLKREMLMSYCIKGTFLKPIIIMSLEYLVPLLDNPKQRPGIIQFAGCLTIFFSEEP